MHALVPLPDLFAFTCLVLFSNSTTIVLIDAAEVVSGFEVGADGRTDEER